MFLFKPAPQLMNHARYAQKFMLPYGVLSVSEITDMLDALSQSERELDGQA